MANPNNNMNMYNQALQINRELKKKLDKTFTIDEIEDVWFSIYNEELKEDNPRFLEELEQQLK
jgi:2-phosphoglycerate kinase